MVSQGDIAGASRLATTPGVLKPSVVRPEVIKPNAAGRMPTMPSNVNPNVAGSQIRQIGRGSEGIATLVAHPDHGVAVRKLYDPRGMSSPEMIARKEEAGRALGDNPHVAKFLGSAQTPHRGGTMHFNEYVPSQKGQAQASEWAQQAGTDARAAIARTGFQGHDIRRGNMVLDSRTGQHKVVDYIPGRPGEMAALDSSNPHHITVTPEGAQLFNSAQNPTTTKGLLGGMLGGKRMGVRRNAGVPGQGTLLNGDVGTAPQRPAPIAAGTPARTQAGFAPGPGSASSIAPTQVAKPQTPKPPNPSSSEQNTSVIRGPKPVQGITPFQP